MEVSRMCDECKSTDKPVRLYHWHTVPTDWRLGRPHLCDDCAASYQSGRVVVMLEEVCQFKACT